eukprot:SAG22_NODE_65_length_23128_cov_51.766609_3_plen_226_part_00
MTSHCPDSECYQCTYCILLTHPFSPVAFAPAVSSLPPSLDTDVSTMRPNLWVLLHVPGDRKQTRGGKPCLDFAMVGEADRSHRHCLFVQRLHDERHAPAPAKDVLSGHGRRPDLVYNHPDVGGRAVLFTRDKIPHLLPVPICGGMSGMRKDAATLKSEKIPEQHCRCCSRRCRGRRCRGRAQREPHGMVGDARPGPAELSHGKGTGNCVPVGHENPSGAGLLPSK